MSYKSILVHYENNPSGAKRIEAAARLATTHDALLIGLVLSVDPALSLHNYEYVSPVMLEELVKSARQTTERTIMELRAILGRQTCRTELRIADCAPPGIGATLAMNARYADLLVLGQPFPTDPTFVDRRMIGQVLVSSGRPVLVVPYIGGREAVGERVLVAWDAGREAARSVADAMPVLKSATSVAVLTVNSQDAPGAHGDVPGADIATHLARHGIEVEVSSIRVEDVESADAVLSWIADHGIDLLVMGAYAHSRIRELVLGGMTRSILDRMTVPVLMSH